MRCADDEVMKRHGILHNMPEALLHYRIHDEQVTRQNSTYWHGVRDRIVAHHTRETADDECVPFSFDSFVNSDGSSPN